MNFLHIPKCGGTALKYAIEGVDNPPYGILAMQGHIPTLQNTNSEVFFQIRDPWERFCSAFWERKTVHARQQQNAQNGKTSFGYAIPTPSEQRYLDSFDTPDNLCSYLRTGGNLTGILEELASPHNRWLGNLESYKQHEHKVKLVYETKHQDAAVLEHFGITCPQDAFSRRSRRAFDRPQSYECSEQNHKWFIDQYRPHEYELLAYITVQQYYWRP